MGPATVPDDWRIPDELGQLMELCIPKPVKSHRFGGGRPRTPDRVCADAIFFVLRTGCQGKALDATQFCPGSTAHDRFQEWVEAGVFYELWKAGLLDYDCLHGIN
jgi:transposase